MQIYSDNWQLLNALLAGFTHIHHTPVVRDYRGHAEARMLGIFLAHAKLTTPRLSRETVVDLLAGRQTWPRRDGGFDTVRLDISVDRLEELGLVSFYADWCSVHCDYVRDPELLDESLQPLLQALQLLKDMRSGNAGFAQPQYCLPFDEALQLLAPEFGELRSRAWLETLEQHADGRLWPTPSSRMSEAASTQLWLALRETSNASEAFKEWLVRQCVGRDWCQSIDFAYLSFEERQVYIVQLTEHLASDRALAAPYSELQRQTYNQDHLSHMLRPAREHLDIQIDAEGARSSRWQTVYQTGATLDTLEQQYPAIVPPDTPSLQFVTGERISHSRRGLPLFHLALVHRAMEVTLHLDGTALTSDGFAERLFDLASSRPILRHLALVALPQIGSTKRYLLLLLSWAETCDVALSYLADFSHADIHQCEAEVAQSLDKGYHQMLCVEYRRAIEKEPESGARLHQIVEHLARRCNWQAPDFTGRSEYQLLMTFLQGLSQRHIAQLISTFATSLSSIPTPAVHDTARPYRYFIAFWLLERLEQLSLDCAAVIRHTLQTAIFDAYAAEFEGNIQAVFRTLEPEECYAVLPWARSIQGRGLIDWLGLSKDYYAWLPRLSADNVHSYAVARAIRQHLQMLMVLQPPQVTERDFQRVVQRVASIMFTVGIGQHGTICWLFEPGMQSERDRVWDQFSRYISLFSDSLFEEFLERCVPYLPLDMLFTLLENNSALERREQLHRAIGQRHSTHAKEMGLTALEQAFISAVNSGELALGGTLIKAAEEFLSGSRFTNTRNSFILQGRKTWSSYQYKWQLLMLMEQLRDFPDEFARQAAGLDIPHKLYAAPNWEESQRLNQDCRDFSQYITAAAYRDTNPQRCAQGMTSLFTRTQDPSHGLLLLQSWIDLHHQEADHLTLNQTLHSCLASVEHLSPEHLTSPWVAAVLEAYALLGDKHKLDAFWARLSWHQQTRLEILRPYCKALIGRGEVLVAQHLVTRYRELNPLAVQLGSFTQLMDELANAAPSQVSLSQLAQLIGHPARRSVAQLQVDYRQIVTLDLTQYVEVTGNGVCVEEFLAQIVLEVAGELLLRKKNLQLHSTYPPAPLNRRISHEDLINDWFTSLFDKRMAESRIGLRDQKRAGESASGKSPGEVDGFITDSKSRRLAVFEAFRLFSLDLTVIREHLDKIARYDQECLSPVFIVAYCDVVDFAALALGYAQLIEEREYFGFQRRPEVSPPDQLRSDSNLWLAKELRARNGTTITLYHLLLNMRNSAGDP